MSTTELVPLDQVADILLQGGDLDVIDADAMQADMVRRVLQSETLADAFADFTAVPAEQIEGIAVEVHGVAFVKSAYDEGPAVYALMQIYRPDTKERIVVSMGGRTLMASFVWAMRHEAMPLKGAFVRAVSRSNASRFYWTFKLAQR